MEKRYQSRGKPNKLSGAQNRRGYEDSPSIKKKQVHLSQERQAVNDGRADKRLGSFVMQSAASNHGNDDEEDQVPGLGIYQRLSIFASNGYDNDGRSPNTSEAAPEDAENRSGAHSKTGEDDEEEERSDADRSVDLLDDGLEAVGAVMLEKAQERATAGQVDALVLSAIRRAENSGRPTGKQVSPDNQNSGEHNRQPGEYESLVWGQSIWSSSIPKESAKRFMANLQQMQSSDITGPMSGRQEPMPPAENAQAKEEYDELQKEIAQQTVPESYPEEAVEAASNEPASHPDIALYPVPPVASSQPSEHYYIQNVVQMQEQ
jgi:hypothetical protein